VKLLLLVMAGALLALPTAAQTGAPDPGRLAVASQVAKLLFSDRTLDRASMRMIGTMLPILEAQVALDEAQADVGTPPAQPTFDDQRLQASLELGIGPMSKAYEAAAAQAYARAFTLEELRGMLAFFGSPDGAATITHRVAYAEHDTSGSPGGTPAEPYVESAAEQAFDASAPGLALKQHEEAMSLDMARELAGSLWPPAVDTAQADYCAHATCGPPERAVFARLARIWDKAAHAEPAH